MATLVLGLVGNWLGGSLIGALGAIAGRFVDQVLFEPTITREGPRLSDLTFSASTEGAPMPRVWGRMRVSTQVIWATRYKEEKKTSETGGKGGPKVKTTEYSYSVSFAIGLCEGPISGVGRVWADGKVIDLSDYTHRLNTGDETQEADPLIAAIEGEDRAPGFRGTAYLVFEDMPLEKFGNRVPQLTVEVIRRPPAVEPGLEDLMKAVTVIPGTTEFGYATTPVFTSEAPLLGIEASAGENVHAGGPVTDFVASLNQLEEEAPGVAHVSLVVAWHGDDLRCGNCQIRPRVENAGKYTSPFEWRVGPVTRDTAVVVSQISGTPAVGGAPGDRSVYEAIVELKARGFEVTLYPFILMDIAAGNGLADPYGGGEQAAYPWRGRITCHPAPGQPGTVDKTATAATQVAAFFGAADAADFAWDAAARHVTYAGPDEWGLRRQVLHLATIAAAAGGVDMFLIGSELVALTTVRSAASTYPAVAQLASLAAEVRSIVGGSTRLGYAADWSEYHSHRPGDGSGDVFFHLDPLWADAEIDFVGIDNYLPIADWRDGTDHLDAVAGAPSIYDLDYLRGNIEGGEYFDWFYANDAARDAQTRTPITDGGGKPWVYRNKDIRSWWLNQHFNRPGGVEAMGATAWVPQAKPIVFTEIGCPAVDKGANQPNVFIDAKSSESALPHYSSGRRDDAMQRAYLEAWLGYWQPAAGNNPLSGVYAGRMVDHTRSHVWTWDARPWPEFPQLVEVWADGPNWELGHWLTGRLGAVRLADVVDDIAGGFGVTIDVSDLTGLVLGYQADRVMSARDLIGPLATTHFFDGYESGSTIRFRHRGAAPAGTFSRADVVQRQAGDFALTRAQESELPRGVDLRFYRPDADYRQSTARSRRLSGEARAIAQEGFAIALRQGRAGAIADIMLFQAHIERDSAEFGLPPSALAWEAGDVAKLTIEADAGERSMAFRIGEIGLGADRPVRAVRQEAQVYDQDDGPETTPVVPRPKSVAPPAVHFLDIPMLSDGDSSTAHAPRVAAWSSPWLPVDVYRGPGGLVTPLLDTGISQRAPIGVTTAPLARGPAWRWDRASELTVKMATGESLVAALAADVLAGANVGAVKTAAGRWEIVQWRDATLLTPRTWRLTTLLRGQRGSDADMADEIAAGAAFVVLDGTVQATALPASLARSPQTWSWGPSNRLPNDPLFQSAELTFEAIGLRPLSPVFLRADRDIATGDVALSWIRRTRLGGDDWDAAEVPLGEASERYLAEVMDGVAVKRAFDVTLPTADYTAAEQTADWGAPPASIVWRVRQWSAAIGWGAARSRTSHL
ncbi:hypothetical protein FQ775_00975 [Nitratireductor mangrovi]|uniref:Host specificity protein n=1 Tax=Nitratireductor mangrovi TaxID=2599600 RepID=A0A5B8KTX7_9HYPH|nr:glycoside hydrolase/phage tail family protein [Nitratireductor mangrovi]QDY99054.1 hypothetical protein FQ775_00975 [Nitratireductor mangrovi]